MNLDVLVFGAHPDDAELAMGGTIAKLTSANFRIGIIDLSRGELGTRGSAETRQKEAFQAGIILKISQRENLSIPDGDIQKNKENLTKIIMCLRKYRPRIVFAPYKNDRHPDHVATSRLVKEACFFAGLPKIKTFEKEILQSPYRPSKLYYFMQTYTFEPDFIVDITDNFSTKMESIKAYSTQFYDPKSTEPETFISRPEFLDFIESRANFYGFKIGKKYAEPFATEGDVELKVESLF
ncbi:MAG TPA: bacillithiol biosynthesis deacetylase BshB1 [Bacteroidetes bacterium]|nr:bacillithiol biosynthesis deacetylase BshB1 [Bacteroidota bacterium]HRI46138.1 bacillithiol biosynthesis deacetylase BshB1 [Ignavibacteriaceae bacterium]